MLVETSSKPLIGRCYTTNIIMKLLNLQH